MLAAARTPGRDRIAITASIVLHLCALSALVAVPQPAISTDDPDERTLFAHIIRIEHRPPPARAPAPARRPRAPVAAVANAPLPVIHTAVTVEHSARRLVVRTERRAASVEAQLAARRNVAAVPDARAVAVAPPTIAPQGEALTTAPPAAPATTRPAAVVTQREEGIGNFGETYPAAIDPALRGALFAGVNGIVVRITVDENGHATAVEFVRPPADPSQRDELRARLLAARFTPASCNGLRCAGSVEVKN